MAILLLLHLNKSANNQLVFCTFVLTKLDRGGGTNNTRLAPDPRAVPVARGGAPGRLCACLLGNTVPTHGSSDFRSPRGASPVSARARLRGRRGPHPRCGSGKKRSQCEPVHTATAFCKEFQCFSAHLWQAGLLLRPPSAHAFSYGLPHGSAKAALGVPVRQHCTAAHSHHWS